MLARHPQTVHRTAVVLQRVVCCCYCVCACCFWWYAHVCRILCLWLLVCAAPCHLYSVGQVFDALFALCTLHLHLGVSLY